MMKLIAFLGLSLFTSPFLNAQYLSKEDQIKSAVLAAPASERDGAHVFGFNEAGDLITLREGTNNFVVRADNPTQPGFEVVSYPKDVEPFMARGRTLREEGKDRGQVLQMREDEMKNGTLQKPNYGSTLAIYYGENAKYNAETDELEGGKFRYVIYTPLATAESTGLPISPKGKGHPWVMFPGLYRAHIMITPPDGE